MSFVLIELPRPFADPSPALSEATGLPRHLTLEILGGEASAGSTTVAAAADPARERPTDQRRDRVVASPVDGR